MKNYILICGKPIYFYEDEEYANVYDICLGNQSYRSLPVSMLKEIIDDIAKTWRSSGLKTIIVQDNAVKSDIYLFPVPDINHRKACRFYY